MSKKKDGYDLDQPTPVMTADERQQERRERFLRLAPRRKHDAVAKLGNLAACANTLSYEYTEEEAAKIVAAVQSACDACVAAYSGRQTGKPVYTL